MDPQRWLELADDWSVGDDEAYWRAGAAHAYFAAFHSARQLFAACRFAVPRADRAHAYLWKRLFNCKYPLFVEAGRALKRLRDFRNRAHYDLDISFPQTLARDTVSDALDLTRLFAQAVADKPTLDRVAQGVRDYERLTGEDTFAG